MVAGGGVAFDAGLGLAPGEDENSLMAMIEQQMMTRG
jgi:hypothetical protein